MSSTDTEVRWADCGRDEIEEFREQYNEAESKEKVVEAMAAFLKSDPTLVISSDDVEPVESPCIWTGDDGHLKSDIKKFLDLEDGDDWGEDEEGFYGFYTGWYVEEYAIDMDGKSVSRKIVTYYGSNDR